MDHFIEITPSLRIPLSELRLGFSMSGGPGGQNVNRVSTRVEVLFDVGNTRYLDDNEKRLLKKNTPIQDRFERNSESSLAGIAKSMEEQTNGDRKVGEDSQRCAEEGKTAGTDKAQCGVTREKVDLEKETLAGQAHAKFAH